MKKYTAEDIANYFLAINPSDEEGEGLTNLKLQKLLYYAQGFYLALCDKTLFSEELEAWTHGPVVRELYNKYKEYGKNPIPTPTNFNLNKIDASTKEILNDVFHVYGQYSAWRLRDLTQEEFPWIQAYKKNLNYIAHNNLKSFFKTQLENE